MAQKENYEKNYISLAEAAKGTPYSQEYLSLRARQGKLKAVKFGKIWMTKKEWLKEYLKRVEDYKNQIQLKKAPFFKRIKIKKILPTFLISLAIVILMTTYIFKKELLTSAYQNFLVSIQNLRMQFAQRVLPTPVERKEILKVEPYLTINAQTDINAPLNVKEEISAPTYQLTKGEYKATITSLDLTADRTYQFPDLSGIVCLTAGNCFGIFGEVTGMGIENRLAKFVGEREIGVSSINDFFVGGISVTIDSAGNVGIGIEEPLHPLHVRGRIQATGDVCTDLEGGRCLSQAIFELPPIPPPGITGEGIENYIPIWTGISTLGNSIISQFNSTINVEGTIRTLGFEMPTGAAFGYVLTSDEAGRASWRPLPPPPIGVRGTGTTGRIPLWIGSRTIGDSIISQLDSLIDVEGTIEVSGFRMPTGASSGYVLTAIDAAGNAEWQPAPTGVLPPGQAGQTLRHDGTDWVATYFLYNTGSAIGIGTTSTLATLTLSGDAIFSTTTLPQLRLAYDSDSYLDFEISDAQTLIEASHNLVINSLTGQVWLANNVTDFYATSTTIRGLTFISDPGDSTVRKSGEYVFRSAIPIFRYPIAAQSTSTGYVVVSKQFLPTDSLNAITPPQLPGTSRKYAFLINFADDIPTTSSSTWRVYRPQVANVWTTFQFQGQELLNLDVGNPFLSDYFDLPDNDWQLEVALPSADRRIRIFNILLLVFDQLP